MGVFALLKIFIQLDDKKNHSIHEDYGESDDEFVSRIRIDYEKRHQSINVSSVVESSLRPL